MTGPSPDQRPRWPAWVAVVAAATLLFLAAQPASAGAPRGTYECFNLGYWFKLKGDHRYTVQTGGGFSWPVRRLAAGLQ